MSFLTMPSYILKKQLVFLGKNQIRDTFRTRSAGRLKTYLSYTDLRAWSLECEENRQYFLDIVSHAGLPIRENVCSEINPSAAVESSSICDAVVCDEQSPDVCGMFEECSPQCEKNEEAVLEEMFQVLESVKQILNESFNTDCCSKYGGDVKTTRKSEKKKKELSSRECPDVLDNLHKETESNLYELEKMRNAPLGMRNETEIEHLEPMINNLKNRIMHLEESIRFPEKQGNDLKDLYKHIKHIRRQNNLVREYLEFVHKLSHRMMKIDKKKEELFHYFELLRKDHDRAGEEPNFIPESSKNLETLKNNWTKAMEKVKDFGSFGTVLRKELLGWNKR